MKVIILCVSLLTSFAWGKELENFNKSLIQNVQKDIQTDNDEQFRSRSIGRGPASMGGVEVEPEIDGKSIQQENKIDKNVRQLGTQKW